MDNQLVIDLLCREIEDLKDIIICMTHHDGAVEEYRSRWEPVVKAELHQRYQESKSKEG